MKFSTYNPITIRSICICNILTWFLRYFKYNDTITNVIYMSFNTRYIYIKRGDHVWNSVHIIQLRYEVYVYDTFLLDSRAIKYTTILMYTAHFIVSYTSDDVLSIYACTASLAFGPQIWSASTANLRPQPNKPKAVLHDTPRQYSVNLLITYVSLLLHLSTTTLFSSRFDDLPFIYQLNIMFEVY